MSKKEFFKQLQKMAARRDEIFAFLLADLILLNRNCVVLLDKCKVEKAEIILTYGKKYYDKQLKEFMKFVSIGHGFKDCEYNTQGLLIKFSHCSIVILKEVK